MHAAEDACFFRRVPRTPRRSAPCSADGGLALPRMYVASWPHFRRIWETAQKRVAAIRQHTTGFGRLLPTTGELGSEGSQWLPESCNPEQRA